ncbi:MAG TPA: winged helix DNA-binding domain-containing protein [Polyangia bacterium]|nr:winged helix DNA-binding domain-containing protein [Polyangia bacterium]
MNIARRRLANLGIEARVPRSPVDVVRWLVASQAQDFAGAKWALGLRARDADDAAVEAAFNEGAILRTHVLRPTWHFVTPDDIRWLLSLTGPRVAAQSAPRRRQLGLDAAVLKKSAAVIVRALQSSGHLTRDELRAALARARVATEEQRMAYILMHAELEAIICSGPRRGKQMTYALLEQRAPHARQLARADALAELSARYFASRGPATSHDFAKWSGLTLADARAGIEAAAARLRVLDIDGVAHWSGRSSPRLPAAGREPVAHLLSIYDEYISSYRDRRAICDPADARRLVGMGSALAYVVIVDGRVAGTWRRSITRKAVHIQLERFRRLASAEQRAVTAAANRFVRFLGGDRVLQLGGL